MLGSEDNKYEIDELVAIGEKLSRDASRAGSRLGPERIEEFLGTPNSGVIIGISSQLCKI